MSTWAEQCPLDGTCPECGLLYRWTEVIHPEIYEPRWCVEFVNRRRMIPRACLATFLRSFWPWGFWSRLRMSQQIHPWRLLLYVVALILVLAMLYVPIQAAVAVYVRYQVQRILDMQQARLGPRIQSVQNSMQAWMNPALAAASSMPESALQAAKAMEMSTLNSLKQLQANPPRITLSYFDAVMEALLNPLGPSSSGSIVYPTSAAAYHPPNSLWNIALYSGMGGWTSTGPIWTSATRACRNWLCAWLALLAMMPASLVLLPISRRKAKVRWGHIGRVVVYSLFIPITIVFICAALVGFGLGSSRQASSYAEWMLWTLQIVPPILIFSWWAAAISRYLRIPHGLFTVLMLMVMCGVMIIIVVWFIDRRILVYAFM